MEINVVPNSSGKAKVELNEVSMALFKKHEAARKSLKEFSDYVKGKVFQVGRVALAFRRIPQDSRLEWIINREAHFVRCAALIYKIREDDSMRMGGRHASF